MAETVAISKVFIVKAILYTLKGSEEIWCHIHDEYRRIEFNYKPGQPMIDKMMGRPKVYFKARVEEKTLKLGDETQMQQW